MWHLSAWWRPVVPIHTLDWPSNQYLNQPEDYFDAEGACRRRHPQPVGVVYQFSGQYIQSMIGGFCDVLSSRDICRPVNRHRDGVLMRVIETGTKGRVRHTYCCSTFSQALHRSCRWAHQNNDKWTEQAENGIKELDFLNKRINWQYAGRSEWFLQNWSTCSVQVSWSQKVRKVCCKPYCV